MGVLCAHQKGRLINMVDVQMCREDKAWDE